MSASEQTRLQELVPSARISTVAWSYEMREAVPPFAARTGLLFVGGFFAGVSPNTQSLCWFLDEIFPRVLERDASMTLQIIGGDAPVDLMTRASDAVTFLGRVGPLASHYDRARIVIAPLVFGAGLKGKVIESWAHGVPVVATPIAFEGFPAESSAAVALAESPADFAARICDLNRSPVSWRHLQENGYRTLRRFFSPQAVQQAVSFSLENILEPRLS